MFRYQLHPAWFFQPCHPLLWYQIVAPTSQSPATQKLRKKCHGFTASLPIPQRKVGRCPKVAPRNSAWCRHRANLWRNPMYKWYLMFNDINFSIWKFFHVVSAHTSINKCTLHASSVNTRSTKPCFLEKNSPNKLPQKAWVWAGFQILGHTAVGFLHEAFRWSDWTTEWPPKLNGFGCVVGEHLHACSVDLLVYVGFIIIRRLAGVFCGCSCDTSLV